MVTRPSLQILSLGIPLVLASLPAVSAQSTISDADRYAYVANAGWVDLRPSAADGVVVTETYLSGYAYAANFGWIDFGDGSPTNGHTYANDSSADYGVNVGSDGALTGFAYGANVGWIQFEQGQGMPKVDFHTGQVTGFAYGANIGWLSLDTPSSDLATDSLSCPDTDNDGIGDAYERFYFGNLTTLTETGDKDGDGSLDVDEYLANTHPGDASNFLRVLKYSYDEGSGESTLTFNSSPSRVYRIESDDDLAGPWTDSPLGTFAPDAGASTTRAVTPPAGGRRFFRAIAEKPLQ